MNDNDVRILTEVEQRAKSNSHQIEEIKEDVKEIKAENKAIYSLVESIKTISESVADMKIDIKEIKKSQGDLSIKISEVESKPARELFNNISKLKWSIVISICSFLVSGILGVVIIFANR